MHDRASRLADNLARVRERIATAASQSGRDPASVTLVAVTKYADQAAADCLAQLGCKDLAESRPQELWAKAAAAAPDVRWHLVGHLQRNKIRRTLPLVHLIHSVDSLRLLSALHAEAEQLARGLDVLLEVNISGDKNKHGFAPDSVELALAHAAQLQHVSIRGLMGMASLAGGHATAEHDFARLRELRDRLTPLCPKDVSLAELSMGMSDDYEIAIRHGATLVRIGSALFEGV